MSVNPYESPETVGSPAAGTANLRKLVFRVLAAVGVLGVIVVLLLPARRTSSEAARRMQCGNHLKQIALALQCYADEYHCLPPAYTVNAEGKPLHSWRTLILPYIENKKLYDEIDFSKPWDDPANRAAYETNLSFYHCPSGNAGKSQTTYLAVVAPGGCFQPTEPRTLAEITDGTSRTLIVIEVPDEHAVHWMSPHDASEELILNLFKKGKPPHPNGTMAAFVDGHTFLLPRNSTPEVLRALISIAGSDNDVARSVD